MIDNFNQIKDILEFDSEDDFYHLQILKRKKEHPELKSNAIVIKSYYISSIDYLIEKKEEIIAICNHHTARACINLNRRSFEKIAFQLLRKVTDQILNKDFRSARKAYESVCGAYPNEKNKKWIVDIDTNDIEIVRDIARAIYYCDPHPGEVKVDAVIKTKNGYHLISKPFNTTQFAHKYPNIDIQKDNPTLLYFP